MFFSKKAPKQKGGCLDTLDTPGSVTEKGERSNSIKRYKRKERGV